MVSSRRALPPAAPPPGSWAHSRQWTMSSLWEWAGACLTTLTTTNTSGWAMSSWLPPTISPAKGCLRSLPTSPLLICNNHPVAGSFTSIARPPVSETRERLCSRPSPGVPPRTVSNRLLGWCWRMDTMPRVPLLG